jgi:colicin import membrane protein
MTLNNLKNKTPKIVKAHPLAFGFSMALHLVILVTLLSEQAPEKQQQPLKKIVEVKQQKVPLKTLSADNTTVKKTVKIKLNQYIISEVALNKARKIKQQNLKRKKRRLRELEDKRYKKQRAINKLKAKAKKEQAAKKLAEKARKAAEKKTKDAEKKTKKIEKQLKLEAKKFKAEQEKRALAKQAQLKQDEERKIAQAGVVSELQESYINQISSRVRGEWRYQGGKDYWGCEVHIVQDEGGIVKAVDLKSCNVDNQSKVKSFKNAIKRAVNKASPLPAAPDKRVFDKKIIFKFKVN